MLDDTAPQYTLVFFSVIMIQASIGFIYVEVLADVTESNSSF